MTVGKLSRVVAAGVVALGLVLSGGMPANAAPAEGEPSVTVVPSTGLSDGDVVALSATGLNANTAYHVGECAELEPAVFACNEAESFSVTTDAAGAVTTPVTVRRTFEGRVNGEPRGTMDCTVLACGIALSSDAGDAAGAPISFA